MPFKHVHYEKLTGDEPGVLDEARANRASLRAWARGLSRRAWTLHALLLTFSMTLFSLSSWSAWKVRSCTCQAVTDWSTPGFEGFQKRDMKIAGSFVTDSPYRGEPSPEVDAAWNRYTSSQWIDGTSVVLSVGEDEITHARKNMDEEWSNSTVELGDANGGGTMATLEIFHQMHCLDLLRKYTYYNYPYYKTSGGVFGKPIDIQKNHIDHCLEIVRQLIMCNADTGLIVFHWTEASAVPYPDFNVWHSCRDPEEVLALAKQREAPMTHRMKKTDGITIMPTPP